MHEHVFRSAPGSRIRITKLRQGGAAPASRCRAESALDGHVGADMSSSIEPITKCRMRRRATASRLAPRPRHQFRPFDERCRPRPPMTTSRSMSFEVSGRGRRAADFARGTPTTVAPAQDAADNVPGADAAYHPPCSPIRKWHGTADAAARRRSCPGASPPETRLVRGCHVRFSLRTGNWDNVAVGHVALTGAPFATQVRQHCKNTRQGGLRGCGSPLTLRTAAHPRPTPLADKSGNCPAINSATSTGGFRANRAVGAGEGAEQRTHASGRPDS